MSSGRGMGSLYSICSSSSFSSVGVSPLRSVGCGPNRLLVSVREASSTAQTELGDLPASNGTRAVMGEQSTSRPRSEYQISCVCGRLVRSHEAEAICLECGRQLAVDWPARLGEVIEGPRDAN